MAITTSKKNTKKPTKRKLRRKPDWADEGNNKAIRPEAYNKIVEWLALPDDDNRAAKVGLLTHGLPWGSVVSGEYHRSQPDLIGVKAMHKDWNSPRLFDPAAFALMQLLTAFGGRLRMNNRQATDPAKQQGPKHFFPAVNLDKTTNFALARIIWGATTAGTVDQIKSDAPITPNRNINDLVETFYDLRLANLTSEASQKPADRTRGDAVRAALIFHFNMQKKLVGLPISDDYLKAIMKCFDLLDALKAKVLQQRKG